MGLLLLFLNYFLELCKKSGNLPLATNCCGNDAEKSKDMNHYNT